MPVEGLMGMVFCLCLQKILLLIRNPNHRNLMTEGIRNCSDSPEHEQSKKIKTISPMEAPVDGEIVDLPREIIIQILKILPVKSLLRLRCVCKSWLSLISSSEFIKTHLNYSIHNANLINHRIMLNFDYPIYNLKHCLAHYVMFEPLTDASDIDYPRRNQHRSVRIVGSCNGLICFTISKQDIYLWNPSTRKSKNLPHPAVKLKGGFYCMYGFGYNESDDDYKVVSIYCDLQNAAVYKSPVKIYSLRTNSWKRIGDFDGGVPFCCGKFASGKLHFIPKLKSDSNCELAIVSLDLKSEVYGKVELPSYEEGSSAPLLGVLGGCICLTLNYRQIYADVWVLKEYDDVKESWTKLVSIPYVDPLKFGFHLRHGIGFYSNPVLMLPSGEILLVFAECLVIYNPKDNCFRRPGTSNMDYFLDADMYVESLVSL